MCPNQLARHFLLMIEGHEIDLVIESLMVQRARSMIIDGVEDRRYKALLRRIITRARVPYCKHVAPDAYHLCFPNGPEYAEELASGRFRTGRAFMILIESYETGILIESLMQMHSVNLAVWHSEDHRIKPLLSRILSHAGLPYSKRTAPRAYDFCFPEGPPKLVDYGKYTKRAV